MAQPSVKNLPLSPAAHDLGLGLGDALQSQVQAQIIDQKKKRQQQQPANQDMLSSLMNTMTPAVQSLYGTGSIFGS